jgi:DNA polymerase-1
LQEKLVDGKINPSYHTLTNTGRLGSRNPNAQNIKAKSEIRHCFVPPKGHMFIDLDYSQIELRVVAHLSQDPQLLKVYKEDGDVHQSTADGCGCTRQDAKVINFGLIYKMHYTTLAKQLKISEDEADRYSKGYFVTYRGVATWQKNEILKARTYGRTRTILGRPREFPEIHASNKWIREKKEREAINHPVQGSAGEICKLAMIDVENDLILRSLGATLHMQIHDELVLACPVKAAPKALERCRYLMENSLKKRSIKFSVPLKAEGGIGTNWQEAKEAG